MGDEELDDFFRGELEARRREKESEATVNAVYDTMVFIQAASRPDRIHATFPAVLRSLAPDLCTVSPTDLTIVLKLKP